MNGWYQLFSVMSLCVDRRAVYVNQVKCFLCIVYLCITDCEVNFALAHVTIPHVVVVAWCGISVGPKRL